GQHPDVLVVVPDIFRRAIQEISLGGLDRMSGMTRVIGWPAKSTSKHIVGRRGPVHFGTARNLPMDTTVFDGVINGWLTVSEAPKVIQVDRLRRERALSAGNVAKPVRGACPFIEAPQSMRKVPRVWVREYGKDPWI